MKFKGQGQTVKIVYALPFEPVVRSRSILGLGLPSSANGKCDWLLPVHWNCLFVSNQGAFNVSRVSDRSALIGRDVAEGVHYRTVIWYSTFPNVCHGLCTTWGNTNLRNVFSYAVCRVSKRRWFSLLFLRHISIHANIFHFLLKKNPENRSIALRTKTKRLPVYFYFQSHTGYYILLLLRH